MLHLSESCGLQAACQLALPPRSLPKPETPQCPATKNSAFVGHDEVEMDVLPAEGRLGCKASPNFGQLRAFQRSCSWRRSRHGGAPEHLPKASESESQELRGHLNPVPPQASKQASKQASRQAGKTASKQKKTNKASKQTNKHAKMQKQRERERESDTPTTTFNRSCAF